MFPSKIFLDYPALILAPSTSAGGVICPALSIGHIKKRSPFALVSRSATSKLDKIEQCMSKVRSLQTDF